LRYDVVPELTNYWYDIVSYASENRNWIVEKLKRIPNSVDTLAPTNRFVIAINTIPITPGIPCHTIMGDRGRGDAPNSSDGVMPYSSSNMDGAESELVVPSGHGAHQNPKAIQEVRRILMLNAEQPGSKKNLHLKTQLWEMLLQSRHQNRKDKSEEPSAAGADFMPIMAVPPAAP
jgi:hypothetical protein